MGWLRLVGSLKFQVSFAKYSLFYRALLQQRPIIYRAYYRVLVEESRVYVKRVVCQLKRVVWCEFAVVRESHGVVSESHV